MLYLVGDSNTAKSFVLIDAKSQHYYKSNLQTTWKSLDAWLYPMTVENLNKIYSLKKQVEVGLEVLFLPIEPYITGQAKYLGLEKFRKHYVYRPWEGVPSFIFLDKFIDLWVSQGGCNHEELQNFLKQSYVKLDSNSFDPYKYENCKVSKPTHSNVPTKSDVMEDFQRTCQLKLLRNGLKNLVSKRTTQVELEIQKLSEKEDKIRKLEKEVETRKLRYQRKSECGLRSIIEQKLSQLRTYTVRKNRDIETAVFTNIKGEVVSVKDFLLSEFGSSYLNVPFTTHEILVGERVVGGLLTLNLTELSRTKITDFVYYYHNMYLYTFKYERFSFKDLKDSEFKRLQTLFDFRCEFDHFKDSGLFFKLGLVNNYNPFAKWDDTAERYENPVFTICKLSRELTKTDIYFSVSYWFERHTDTVTSVKYKERQWLNREVIESEIPKNNTNIVYVCYLPDSQVIKVGRTENWVSRRGVYTRSSGSNPKTNGRMRLCYFWETIKTGDSVIDKYIMFCAEDHLKRLANQHMTLVEGKEYFEGCDINEYVSLVKDYFSKIDLETLLRIRSLSKLKQFAQNEQYNTELLIVKLRQLANL
jgi:hypothetical protein